MRYVLVAVGLLVVGSSSVVFVNWDSITQSYQEAVAKAAELATESGNQMGQGAYHLARCGRGEYMDQLRQSLEELDQVSAEFQADMRTAFEAGVQQARSANVDYTEEFCTNLLAEVEGAQ
jgi:hypothetical protein